MLSPRKPPIQASYNGAAAGRFFPGQDPAGKRIVLDARHDTAPSMEVIGVVRNAKWRNLRETTSPTVYVSLAQVKNPALFLAVRTQDKPLALAGALRTLVRDIDPMTTLRWE